MFYSRGLATIGVLGLTWSLAAGALGAPSGPPPRPPRQPGSLQPSVVETLARSTSIASYDGWSAWSRYDSTHRAFQLIVRDPSGSVSAVGIAEEREPFEVALGPLPNGTVGAVYPRCGARSCHLEELAVGAGDARERRLAVPGGGSLISPALWKDTVAFLRAKAKGGTVEMFEWTSGSKHLKALALPGNGSITALALQGTQVAYTRVAPSEEFAVSNLWVQRPGGQPMLIDNIGTGGGAAFGTRTYLTPTFAGPWLYAYRQYRETGVGDGNPAWVRYSLTSNTTQQAQINFGVNEAEGPGPLEAVVPLGTGVAWVVQNSREEQGAQVLSLASVTWKPIKRPHRSF